MASKAKNQMFHAKCRLVERHGLHLTKKELEDVARDIRAGRAEFIKRQSHRLTHWSVLIGGKRLVVVYDSNRGTLVTFLPGNNPEENNGK